MQVHTAAYFNNQYILTIPYLLHRENFTAFICHQILLGQLIQEKLEVWVMLRSCSVCKTRGLGHVAFMQCMQN